VLPKNSGMQKLNIPFFSKRIEKTRVGKYTCTKGWMSFVSISSVWLMPV
jgi:hypothetical protein